MYLNKNCFFFFYINCPKIDKKLSDHKRLMSTTYKVLLSVLFIHSVFSFSLQTVTDPNLYLVKVTDPDALCLDGSPAAYYVSKDGDPKKIYLQFEGGGWCTGYDSINQTLDDCLSRTKTGQGSSTSYAPSYQFNDGVLSVNSQNNFKDWTRVLLKYCDGSGHQGTRKNPIPYKGTNLYFRGHNVTVGQLNTLERQNKLFSEATHVVVGGDSAGGLAVFLWTNYIKERVKVGKVWAIPDSGIFLDSVHSMTKQPEYKNMFKNLISITDLQIAPPVPECAQKFKDSLQNCMFATNLAPYIKAPMFIIQSLYDTWSIQNILGINCVYDGSLAYCNWDQKTKIHDYHKNTTNAIIDMVYKNPNINGFFAPVCANHVYDTMGSYYSPLFRIPANSQNSIVKGVQSWMEESKDITTYQLIDLGQWPNNRPCAGQVTPWI